MMLLLKITVLQLLWFLVVLYGKLGCPIIFAGTTLIILGLNYKFYGVSASIKRYFFVVLISIIIGLIHDMGLITLGIVDFKSYHFIYLCLWPIFLCYYHDILARFQEKTVLNIFLGGVFGPITYYSALKMNAWSISEGFLIFYYIYIAIFWATLFPLSFIFLKKIKYIR